jgi:hypothetical protein
MMVLCQDERITHFMNLPPQSSSSDEPTLVPVHQDETPAQPSSAADAPSEETLQPLPVDSTSHDISTEETIEQLPMEDSASGDTPTLPASPAEPVLEETEPLLAASHELLAEAQEPPLAASYEADETVVFTEEDGEEEDEEEAFESDLPGSSVAPSSQSGVFIRKGWLIGAISAVVVVALLATLLVFVTRPKDPPTDWIATYTPPAGSTSSGKQLYYLHWTNNNGELTGQLQLAANSSGSLQSLTVPAAGLYNRDNHIIYVVITINGQADTFTGKINDANDTLNLNVAGATDQSSLLVFHIGSASDYQRATKNLIPKKA